MGALYVEGNEPALSGTLIKVQVNANCNVCVEGEPIRGNIVMTDGTGVEANDCEYIMLGCDVPDVLALEWNAAVAAIEAADLVAAPSGVWSGTDPIDDVVSQAPSGGATVECGSTVDIVVSRGPEPANPMPAGAEYDTQRADADTYIDNHWDPNSGSGGWGKPYHCFGDADGATEGIMTKYRVSQKDLNLITANWKKKMGAWPKGANPAADVDHRAEGIMTKYRVSQRDLNRITCYWKQKDAALAANPRGLCPWTGAVNNAWTCP